MTSWWGRWRSSPSGARAEAAERHEDIYNRGYDTGNRHTAQAWYVLGWDEAREDAGLPYGPLECSERVEQALKMYGHHEVWPRPEPGEEDIIYNRGYDAGIRHGAKAWYVNGWDEARKYAELPVGFGESMKRADQAYSDVACREWLVTRRVALAAIRRAGGDRRVATVHLRGEAAQAAHGAAAVLEQVTEAAQAVPSTAAALEQDARMERVFRLLFDMSERRLQASIEAGHVLLL